MSASGDWGRESNLLKPVQNYLLEEFSAHLQPLSGHFDRCAEVTATRGSRPPLGAWSRPDLALVTVWRPAFAGSPQVRLETFEVKTAQGASVESVYEAFAHGRFGHRSHLVWHTPENLGQSELAKQIKSACVRHGVGLICMTVPDDPRSYTIEVAASLLSPDLEVVDEFVSGRFSEAGQRAIRRMLGAPV